MSCLDMSSVLATRRFLLLEIGSDVKRYDPSRPFRVMSLSGDRCYGVTL